MACSALSLAGCGGDDKGATCSNVTNISVEQNFGTLKTTITANDALYYELNLTVVGGAPDAQYYTYSQDGSTGEINLIEQIGPGQYWLYARTVCNGNAYGEWFGPKLVTITAFCPTPYDFRVESGSATWRMSYTTQQVSNYQLQYGPQGFALGSGTTVTVNGDQYGGTYAYAGMQQGVSYDFYVRAYCSNNVGYGEWQGPFTYYATHTQYLCNTPSNVMSTVTYQSASTRKIEFSWSMSGETQSQCVLVTRGSSPESGNIYTPTFPNVIYTSVSTNYDYDFYVRNICVGGTPTAWVLKQVNL